MTKILREELYRILENNPISSSQHQIAKVIIDDLNAGEELNIIHIAKKTFNHKSTVTRFCQNLGFEGFKDFSKEAIEQDNFYFTSPDNIKTKKQSYEDYNLLLMELIANISKEEEIICKISEIIVRKKRLFIFSSHENSLIANDFAEKLSFLNIQCFVSIKNKNVFFLNNILENDLVIFLVSGYDNKNLVRIWESINKNIKTKRFLIGSKTQISKFNNENNTDNTIILNIGKNTLREQLKSFLIQYIFDQIYNLIVYSKKEFYEVFTNPKYII